MSLSQAPTGWLEDYYSPGTSHSDVGILLVHGFTGSPAAMRPWSHFMNEKGYTVRVPRLPGHSRDWRDLNRTKWQEWTSRVDTELELLQKECKRTFIFALSMGGGTTLNVAARHEVDGLVLVNPMIHIPGLLIKFAPIISRVQPGRASVGDDIKKPGVTEWGYDVLPTKGVVELNKLLKVTRSSLGSVKSPLLLFHSQDDHVLPVSNTEIIMSEIGSGSKERVELHNSYHVANLDYDADEIFTRSLAFVQAHS